MKREIKFRGKCSHNDKWVYGTGVFEDGFNVWLSSNKDNTSLASGLRHITVIPETVGQLTGLQDKNGEDIYEGDKVCVGSDDRPDSNYEGIIKFIEGGFYVDTGVELIKVWQEILTWEVIGTIHDKGE